jgi:hypothetical protein
MKILLWHLAVVLAGASPAVAQSNGDGAPTKTLSLSPTLVRTEAATPPTNSFPSGLKFEAGTMELRAESINQSLDRYRWINGTEVLTRSELRDATPLEKIFEPEVIRLKKVHLSGSLITAVKRKNPLCLLNPIIFWMSWGP